MLCPRCGAAVRDTARFCNRCRYPLTPGDAPADPWAALPLRPSRPLRAGHGVAAPVSRPLDLDRPTVDLSGESPFKTAALDPASAWLGPAGGERQAISEQETSENVVITPSGSYPRSAANGPAPWPLPVGDVLMGRFRVESQVSVTPDAPGAENVYRVTDLLGYERCWSCQAAHGPSARDERFCPRCGADMIGHEYLMTERRAETLTDTQPEMWPVAADVGQERAFERGGRRYLVTEIEPEGVRFPFGPHVTIVGASHVGLTRALETNEDSFGSFTLNLGHDSRRQPLAVAVVADGLGGHASGQDASRLAVRILLQRLMKTLAVDLAEPRGSSLPPDDAVEAELRDATVEANAVICQENTATQGDMGSTLVAAVIVGEMAWIANIGDSRAYVLDDGGLRRVTSDHSLVEQFILAGHITPEERYTHPERNRIFKSLGVEGVGADIFTQRLHPGMRLLLCSDGLWEMTRDPEIETILRDDPDPYSACSTLITSANENGGEDNITAVIVQIDA
ncbi:MAG TPA: protein phosphatase 2C domain-containing protein [Ktedonobacterales bacterium]